MRQDQETKAAKRRDFLKLAGVGAAGGAATAAGALTQPVEAAAVSEPRSGYRETEHVRKAYELARF
ncbi:MAG: twin-arginine translocation signal domain-containing protein [Geminicoccaceae bacterium]|nr:twin-arginine translocation signal domain-containing protein [Geminicoccaceae bacterium]